VVLKSIVFHAAILSCLRLECRFAMIPFYQGLNPSWNMTFHTSAA